MRKISLLVFVLLFALSAVGEVPQGVGELVESYRSALSEKNYSAIEGKLATNFDFSGAGPQISPMVLQQIVSTGVYQFNAINEIEAEEMDGFIRVYITGEIEAMGAKREGTDVMDVVMENGVWKILALGSGVAQPMIIQDPTTQLNFDIEGPHFTIIDFSAEHDHIIVEVGLGDGSIANFVVDNGTPISIVGFKHADKFDAGQPMATAIEALGAGGAIEKTGAIMIDYLKIGDFEVSNLTAITMDLDHLSEAMEVEIVGLLGTEFLSKFAWTLDYSGNKMILHRLGADGEIEMDIPGDPIFSRQPTHVIPFDRTMHLLSTEAEFASGVKVKVILDSGAPAGVLVPEIFTALPEDSYIEGESDTLMGADKAKRAVPVITPKKLSVGPILRDDYKIVVSDLSHLNIEGLPIRVDAIVGFNFFSDWLITTWFSKDIIELRPIPK